MLPVPSRNSTTMYRQPPPHLWRPVEYVTTTTLWMRAHETGHHGAPSSGDCSQRTMFPSAEPLIAHVYRHRYLQSADPVDVVYSDAARPDDAPPPQRTPAPAVAGGGWLHHVQEPRIDPDFDELPDRALSRKCPDVPLALQCPVFPALFFVVDGPARRWSETNGAPASGRELVERVSLFRGVRQIDVSSVAVCNSEVLVGNPNSMAHTGSFDVVDVLDDDAVFLFELALGPIHRLRRHMHIVANDFAADVAPRLACVVKLDAVVDVVATPGHTESNHTTLLLSS
mgnify:FL=1